MKKCSLILLVDDDLMTLKVGEVLLQDLGYTVITVENGLEALKILKNRNIDLIILDMNMPKLNGLETLIKIKELDSSNKVIICSGYISSKSELLLYKNGILEILKKPYKIDDLERVLLKFI
ncbi:MAG: response regulator [Spirochaetaceae bacterium]